MSRWQHKNIHKKHLLWAKLFGICLIAHLICLFWVFCVYRDNSYILSLSVHKHMDYSTPIMFIPCYVKTPQGTPIVTKQPTITQKNNIKKTTPEKTVIAAAKPDPTSLKLRRASEKKAPVIPKPAEPAKIAEPIAKVEPNPTSLKLRRAEEQETPKPEPIKTAQEIEPAKPVIPEQKTVQPPIAQAIDVEQNVTPVIPENAHISNNYREVEALRRNAQLQKELVQAWKPPIGTSPECMCEISFFVNAAGAIENLKMIKTSGIVMFDISARQALFAMKMPQWTYGKPFTISFKQ